MTDLVRTADVERVSEIARVLTTARDAVSVVVREEGYVVELG
jgi:hypothetical protein